MLRTYRCILPLMPALLMAVPACQEPQTEAKPWTPGIQSVRADYESHLVTMVDNAILSDMSVADIHFIPHTAELSGVGEVRLSRMAKLLNTYGGTVRYETQLDDEVVIGKRLDHVREYLALTGCDMKRVEVTTGMAGGRGLSGEDAVKNLKAGTAKKQADSGAPLGSGFQGLASP